MDLTAPLIGIVAGFVVGVTSTGGGALLTPALVFILRVPPSLAVGSDVLIASIGSERPLHPDFGTVYQGAPSGIPYIVVGGQQKRVPVTFQSVPHV